LSFLAAPDFETPTDAGANNVYDVIVTTEDKGGLEDSQAIQVTVTNANEAPNITSTAFSIEENKTAVGTVLVTDPDAGDAQTFSITGGADAAKFSIDSLTGALSFLAAPDFETPTDAGANNVYDVIVTTEDKGGLEDSQAIQVTVTNVSPETINGTADDDNLVGGTDHDQILGLEGNDTLSGGGGNDTLDGGGDTDSLAGGADNDSLVWHDANTSVDGGDGDDTLLVQAISIDLSTATLSDIERIDLSATGTTVTLTIADVIAVTDGDNVLTIDGGAGDTANIGVGWTADPGGPAGGYQTYTGGGATLVVDTDITVV
jgi:hypothetical protein